jgi:hypothetical protein
VAAKAASSAPDPAEILRQDQASAVNFAIRAGHERTRAALKRAQKDLERRLSEAQSLRGPGADSFTAAQLRTTLSQVREVLRPLQASLRSTTVTTGEEAAARGVEATIRYLRAADRKFSGVGTSRLPLDEAAMFEQGVDNANASVLSRIEGDPDHPGQGGMLARYGGGVIDMFERELQQRYLARAPWDEVRANVVAQSPFLQGAPASWAERIVRTESMNANNAAGMQSIRVADETLGDMCKILICTIDNRTGSDSIACHGQIRRPEEPFDSWNGSFMHPPDRPNDRATVTPHRISWPIPAYLDPRSDGEVAARWAFEKRKGGMPARPLMSTIDRKRFGAAS